MQKRIKDREDNLKRLENQKWYLMMERSHILKTSYYYYYLNKIMLKLVRNTRSLRDFLV
jgi:hypothetical protein